MSKNKGITVWEQNAEYFVLGVAGLAFVAFIGLQFLGSPNAAEVQGRGTVKPGEVDQLLAEEAERLQYMLSPEAEPTMQIDEPEPVLPQFEQAIVSSVSPTSDVQLARAWVPMSTGDASRGATALHVPELPQPNPIIAKQYFDTLAEGVVEENEQLQSKFTSEPHDLTWITTAAVINLDEVLEEFRHGSPEGEPASIPTSWYADHATVLDVRVERQELVNGEWGSQQVVDFLPGRDSYRPEIEGGEIDALRRNDLLREARQPQVQRQVAQPAFYATKGGGFIPPDPKNPVIETDSEEVRDLQMLRSLERELVRLDEQLDELGGSRDGGSRQDDDDSPRPGGKRPTAPSSDGGPSIGGRSPDGSSDEDDADRDEENRQRRIGILLRRIDRVERQIEILRERLPEVEETDEEDLALRVDGRGELTVWGHDIDVQPGSTYRYRVVVEIYNPFFARRLNLIDEQQDLADDVVISTPASDWSEPVEARSPLHPFITRAYAPGQERGAGSDRETGRAIIEVYRFHDGRWWTEQFNVEPGERVGGASQDGVDFGTDWYVLDIVADVEDSDRDGRSARVVLQSIRSGEVVEVRHPQQDANSPIRQNLIDETEMSELASNTSG